MMDDVFYGGVFMWLLWIIIIAVIIYFVVGGKKPMSFPNVMQESAMDILKKRYAKGEISKEEFEELKRDIES